MAKNNKNALGRGLGALLGSSEPDAPIAEQMIQGDVVLNLKLTDIDPDRDQPRRQFDSKALDELAESIASVGVIQPIIVRRVGSRYQLIAGERRWRAARLAGLSEIPAIVRDWAQHERLEVMLIENLQRDDLNPIEEAQGIHRLMEACGYTQEAAARRLGMSRPAVANLLRLLSLPVAVVEFVKEGKLTAGHARALVSIEEDDKCIRLANTCIAQGWSVRQLERIVQQAQMEKPEATLPVQLPAEFKDLERMARSTFGTRAQIEGSADKGKLVLHYYSADDLQRIWDVLEKIQES